MDEASIQARREQQTAADRQEISRQLQAASLAFTSQRAIQMAAPKSSMPGLSLSSQQRPPSSFQSDVVVEFCLLPDSEAIAEIPIGELLVSVDPPTLHPDYFRTFWAKALDGIADSLPDLLPILVEFQATDPRRFGRHPRIYAPTQPDQSYKFISEVPFARCLATAVQTGTVPPFLLSVKGFLQPSQLQELLPDLAHYLPGPASPGSVVGSSVGGGRSIQSPVLPVTVTSPQSPPLAPKTPSSLLRRARHLICSSQSLPPVPGTGERLLRPKKASSDSTLSSHVGVPGTGVLSLPIPRSPPPFVTFPHVSPSGQQTQTPLDESGINPTILAMAQNVDKLDCDLRQMLSTFKEVSDTRLSCCCGECCP